MWVRVVVGRDQRDHIFKSLPPSDVKPYIGVLAITQKIENTINWNVIFFPSFYVLYSFVITSLRWHWLINPFQFSTTAVPMFVSFFCFIFRTHSVKRIKVSLKIPLNKYQIKISQKISLYRYQIKISLKISLYRYHIFIIFTYTKISLKSFSLQIPKKFLFTDTKQKQRARYD